MVDHTQVLTMLNNGLTVSTVAEALGIHENTVRGIARINLGKCVRCGKRAAPTRTMCVNCLDRDRARIRDQRRQRRKQGVCIECGAPRIEGNRNFCEYHRHSAMKRNERHWLNHKGNAHPEQRRRSIAEKYGDGGLTAWQRDNATCQICGFSHIKGSNGKQAVHLHHINEDRANNSPDNFVCLCFTCHRGIHELLKSPNRKALITWFERAYPDKPLR